jgi:hypothetical protein
MLDKYIENKAGYLLSERVCPVFRTYLVQIPEPGDPVED